jgi:hypothetical protein
MKTMKYKAIEKAILRAMQKPGTRHIAGVEVQTVRYPASGERAVYVLGEKMTSGVHAAGVVYEMQCTSGR